MLQEEENHMKVQPIYPVMYSLMRFKNSDNQTNKSDVACNIYEAKPTCTCISVSSFPEVINPGESNNVIVSFISNIKGKFTRKVVLRTNFSNTLYELTVTGNVI